MCRAYGAQAGLPAGRDECDPATKPSNGRGKPRRYKDRATKDIARRSERPHKCKIGTR